MAAPAPKPEKIRPKTKTGMFAAGASTKGPNMVKSAVMRMVMRRPYLLHEGPAASAPQRPPRV